MVALRLIKDASPKHALNCLNLAGSCSPASCKQIYPVNEVVTLRSGCDCTFLSFSRVHHQLASQHRRYFSAHGISHRDAWSAIRDHNFAYVFDALRSGFPISQRDKFTGRTMLHEAASVGDAEICELLLEWEGCDVHSRCLVGRDTAIHFASIGGNWKVIDMLCRYGALPNDTDKFALTPLHMATSVEVVKHLIRHGADERIHDSFGRTPGMCAEDRGNAAVAELFTEVALRRMQKEQRKQQERAVLAKQAEKARAQRLALQAVKHEERDKVQRLNALKEEYAAWRRPDGKAKARGQAAAKASSSIDGPTDHKALLAKYDRLARDAGRDSALKRLGYSGTGTRG